MVSKNSHPAEHVFAACHQLEANKVYNKVMVDCSHGNSQKKYMNQHLVVKSVCDQLAGIETANGQVTGSHIMGVMLESHLVEGRQDLKETLKYGQSITDSCIGWEDTVIVLNQLANAVKTKFIPL